MFHTFPMANRTWCTLSMRWVLLLHNLQLSRNWKSYSCVVFKTTNCEIVLHNSIMCLEHQVYNRCTIFYYICTSENNKKNLHWKKKPSIAFEFRTLHYIFQYTIQAIKENNNPMKHSKPGCPLVAKLDYKAQVANGNHLLTNCHLVSSHSKIWAVKPKIPHRAM